MKITVYDKSFPEDVAVVTSEGCNHFCGVAIEEITHFRNGYPDTYESEVCEKCGVPI